MNQRQRVLEVAQEAPCTSMEAAALLDLPQKHCCAILRSWWDMGVLTRKPFKRDGIRTAFMYAPVETPGFPEWKATRPNQGK